VIVVCLLVLDCAQQYTDHESIVVRTIGVLSI
jgi:hypothetical protein